LLPTKNKIMKKIMILAFSVIAILIFQNCSNTKKIATEKPVTVVSFDKDVLPMLKVSCTPCHFPPDGRKEPLNTYDGVKKKIIDIIARVKLPKDDVKYMPFKSKKPALSDSAINVLTAWQQQNMPQ
jgi:hypothetical protein